MGGNVVRSCLPRLSLHPLPAPHHISRHHVSCFIRAPFPSNPASVRLVPLLEFDGCRLLFCLGRFRSGTQRHSSADASQRGLSFSDCLGDEVRMTGLVLFGGARRRLKRSICKVQFCCPMAGSEQPSSAVHSRPTLKVAGPKIRFCPSCGGATEQLIPKGEEKPRDTCTVCGSVHYQNPKMVVGCLIEHEDKVLLCRRSIEPSYGLWTLPAGYMELGESAAEGAARETWEEAKAEVEVQALFAQLDIPLIGQSYIIFRAKLKRPHFSPGCESLECALFKFDEIPFEQIAFSSVSVALKMFVEDYNTGAIRVHHGVIDKRPGASPSDPQGYVVRDHICS